MVAFSVTIFQRLLYIWWELGEESLESFLCNIVSVKSKSNIFKSQNIFAVEYRLSNIAFRIATSVGLAC